MQNLFRLQVTTRPQFADARSAALLHDVAALGIAGVQDARVTDLYFLQGDLDLTSAERLAQVLLHDPVTEAYAISQVMDEPSNLDSRNTHAERATRNTQYAIRSTQYARGARNTVEVALHPGVTDSVAETLLASAKVVGVTGLAQAATGQCYTLEGDISPDDVARIAQGLLANATIQTFSVNRPIEPPFVKPTTDDTVEEIPLCDADADRLLAISQERRLSLNLPEMQAIQEYFQQAECEPTDVEMEMLAQTWSEHCVHKTFRAEIDYAEPGGAPQKIDSLLKTYIKAATDQIAKPWVVSAFVDNAGLVRFDERFDLAFKVETHNHPSALEPFGGANTGVGGVIRDVMGVSARPIANTDILCFGPPDLPFDQVPAGALHPRRIAAGVVHGIEDYGNKMGIPTVNGAIVYHPDYTANPLVYCGCLGILPHGAHRSLREAQAGDLVVVMGGRTGRDGLRGATFSSMEMTHETSVVAGTAVQIGHPIHEKQVVEVLLTARDERLYTAVTDCGAGGLSSAVGEMAATLGADVELENVPLKYAGLHPWEIWLSEAQERMVMAVPESNWPRLSEICNLHDVEATVLGRFTGDGRLTVRYHGRPVCQLDADFLHNGVPRRHLQATWTPPDTTEPRLPEPDGKQLAAWLLRMLAHPNVASKESVVRRYDHEVQSGTVVKPLVGARDDGPGDATVIVPLDTLLSQPSTSGFQPPALRASNLPPFGRPTSNFQLPALALSAGINPFYGLLDPYAMAWAAVDEALRNVVAVGADPDRVALLDNFCWGNPNLPDRLGGLVRCARGCYDAALAYGAPFVSGKDSLNNEFLGADGQKRAIPGTLLISALGIVPDANRTATMDLKEPGNYLYIVGATGDELGGSLYYELQGELGANPPQPPAHPLARLRVIYHAIQAGLARACHDCSEGGLVVAAAEMAMAGRCGLEIDLSVIPTKDERRGTKDEERGATDAIRSTQYGTQNTEHETRKTPDLRADTRLFAESLGRFLVEVRPQDAAAFEALCAGSVAIARCGAVREGGSVRVTDGDSILFDVSLDDLIAAWKGGLR